MGPEEQSLIEEIKKKSTQSHAEIISRAEHAVDDAPPPKPPSVPLGNIQADDNVPTPDNQVTPPSEPLIPQSPDEAIDYLKESIEGTSNIEFDDTNAKSPKSKASFEGLKTRHKNILDRTSGVIETQKSEILQLKARIAELEPISTQVESLQSTATEIDELRRQNEALVARNSQLEIYEKKENLYENPQVKQNFIEPMKEYEGRAHEIISSAMATYDGEDVSHKVNEFWNDLRKSKSEPVINNLIDGLGLSPLNAQSLKSHFNQYSGYDRKLQEMSQPEYLDSSIQQMKGQAKLRADKVSEQVYSNVKTQFMAHNKLLEQSEVNREQNYFAHDKVMSEANQTYEALRNIADPHKAQDPNALSLYAAAAMKTAGYDVQHRMLSHLLEERETLLATIGELSEAGSINQTSESTPVSNSGTGSLEDLIRRSERPIRDIVSSFE